MNYRLDRTAFRAGTHDQLAEAEREFWQNQTMIERLRAAAYLNGVAFGYDPEHPPRMDRTVFSIRKHENR